MRASTSRVASTGESSRRRYSSSSSVALSLVTSVFCIRGDPFISGNRCDPTVYRRRGTALSGPYTPSA